MFSMILFADARGGIGQDDGIIPFRNKADLANFKQVTTGHVVIMGRKTWESLPARARPLRDRDNFVLSRAEGAEFQGAKTARSIEELLGQLNQREFAAKKWFIIGGAQLYDAFWAREFVAEIYLTQIWRDFKCAARVSFLNDPDWARNFLLEEEKTFAGESGDAVYRHFRKIGKRG